MARAATTTDAFNAVAEPRRRQLLELLVHEERAVNDLAGLTGLTQPLVSKHLRVLREVGLVQVRDVGRQRLYRLDAAPLRQIQDWLAPFEQLWQERFDALDLVLAELTADPEAETDPEADPITVTDDERTNDRPDESSRTQGETT